MMWTIYATDFLFDRQVWLLALRCDDGRKMVRESDVRFPCGFKFRDDKAAA